MRLFVYEFISGGGLLGGEAPEGSLLREGAAMLRALVEDLARVDGCRVLTTWDARLEAPPPPASVHLVRSAREEQSLFEKLAAQADDVVVIAPETDGVLLDRVRRVEAVGGRLLSPGSDWVALASDKHATGRRLAEAGIPTPYAIVLQPDEALPYDFPYPAVLKPRDGAGSQDVYWIAGPRGMTNDEIPKDERSTHDEEGGWANLCSLRHSCFAIPSSRGISSFVVADGRPWRLEQFCPGMAASISLLCGPAGSVALPACRQILSDDGRFRYLGGSTPLAPSLHARAASLAQRALDALPPAVGYIGFDLVLGDAEDGSQDVVIEVNPRLTTSYVGLRAATDVNLAALMVQVARSRLSAFGCR